MANLVQSGSFPPVLTIIGKDLDAGATFNSDMATGTGLVPAGSLIAYDAAAKTFTPTTTAASVFGILANECVRGTEKVPAMVYRRGTFLRQEVEKVNNIAIAPDGALDKALRALGIFLELSYTDYIGLEPAPSGTTSPVKG